MRRPSSLFAASLFTLMIVLGAFPLVVRAEDEDADEYEVTARVVRTSLLEGQVSLRRSGNKAWEQARLNLPLVEGDTLATGQDARVELQIDAHNFVRIGADSLLRIVTLRSEGIVLSLVEGTMSVRLARFDRQLQYFEIDMPKTTMSVEQSGLYRLDVARDGGLHLTVRDGGRARVYADADGFTLRDERTATLSYAGSAEGDWQFSAAASFDTWDTWVNDRERYLAGRLRYEQRDRYYDADIWGAEELDGYGEWVYADNYGWVWRPHTAATNKYNDWAPYRHGQWRWCPPYGWTWVGDEPWGWAPYHYGRWVYYNQGWCWAPRGYGFRYSRNWWRPALVAFVYLPSSYGEHVAWYPLTYGQHDPHRRNHRPRSRPGRLTPLRGGELNNLRRINPAMARAVTTVPVREFGIDGARLRPAATALARNAINTEPVRARLPIVPRASDQTGVGAQVRDTRSGSLPAARPATLPAETLLERPTGAAAREPGVPLDDELWRTRVYQGRQQRPPRAPAAGAGTDPANRDTGAVARPALPSTRPPLDAGDTDDVDRNYRNNLPSGTRPALPARPAQPPPVRDERPPVAPEENLTPAPIEERPTARPPRTAEPPTPPAEATTPPPESPEIFNPPQARPERPAPPERDMPISRPASPEPRPAPPERREAPAPPQPEQVSQPEPSRPEPARPEPPAPPREEPPPPPAEPAQREETPSPPPPAPDPPPSAPDPPPAPAPEPPREAPSPPPDRTPEEDRARPPLG